ncbi:MgtC/SapB family protein [Jiella sonneratiae]|uniref:Protein MgtC n=1 Tax=Jiella sonneratiae TaxID=2816856 RepID=A0ABS3IXK1_9HYPH|nr:MgtC/SapB family protein [Jiella sonneratiae]MBO0902124.1 MgtC/SapB family protein [Jiella sonneratiae]
MSEIFASPDLQTAAVQLVRLLAALLCSGAIGFEREWRHHSAGLRTHMLVGVGACLFTLLMTILIGSVDADRIRSDPLRVVEAVTSGVAFLAAGAIIQSRGKVHGLTTGASLWLAGAIGLACGLGEYILAILAVIVTLLVLAIVRLFER